MYSQMAEFDNIAHTTSYRDLLTTQLPRASTETVLKVNLWISFRLYGYAASKAYVAYKDDQFLALAQQFWEFARGYWISDEDVEAKQ
ncbi:hypothetical protein L218DRAFT_848022, partial [Marasmius fiardii PR-910]